MALFVYFELQVQMRLDGITARSEAKFHQRCGIRDRLNHRLRL